MMRSVNGEAMAPAEGKMAVLIPGMGAVATTFIAGVEAIRGGWADAVGSVTQMGRLPGENGEVAVGEAVPLAELDDLVFGGWDIYEGTAYDAALEASVLSAKDLEKVRPALEKIKPMKAVFDRDFVRNIDGPNVKEGTNKRAHVDALRADIRQFMADNDCDRGVAVWCGSTEKFVATSEVHQSLEALEQGIDADHPDISPSILYAYACLREGIAYANGAPNLTTDCRALTELAEREGVPVAGKDFKTGQTLLKTILAPGFSSRYLGVSGWYSTNILGNRDGAVLDDPGSFKTKEESKLSVLHSILDEENHPELYDDLTHKVRIDYYPPRGDNKEGWDNIDIFGWMGYPMQIKINFLCRDSILAAPLVLDLALLLDLSHRAGSSGVQDWLSFFFKSPQIRHGEFPVHDLFEQQRHMHQTLLALSKMDVEGGKAATAVAS